MRLREVARILNQSCVDDCVLSQVCTDSRNMRSGALFIALRGERFDGERFVRDAVANGASAVVSHTHIPDLPVPQFVVDDTLQALQSLAIYHRDAFAGTVVALTGSNGKTTVKEMLAALLPKPTFATPGNWNNHIGVPLSILLLENTYRYAVFELGANHAGEIAHTVAMVRPTVTLVNNIAPAHLEGFGSIDGVARAKGEIHAGLAAGGVAILNEDDPYSLTWNHILQDKKTIGFSVMHEADVWARNIVFNDLGAAHFELIVAGERAAVQLQVPGLHNVSNALAAVSFAHALGVSIPTCLANLSMFTGVPGRMTFLSGYARAIIIDDTYNANLRSTLAALEVLSKCRGRRIFILGDLGELGDATVEHHETIGNVANAHGIDVLMTCGLHSEATTRAFGKNAQHFSNQDELSQAVLPYLDETTTVLVKGSRAAAMEKVVKQLMGGC